jgi:transposase
MVAATGTGDAFAKGRDFGAWLGLVPKPMSTGDRTILGSISRVVLAHPLDAAPSLHGRGPVAHDQLQPVRALGIGQRIC